MATNALNLFVHYTVLSLLTQSSFQQQSVKQTTAIACNPSTNFQCSNGSCIELKRRCDGINDCMDGSDEHYCPMCDKDFFSCNIMLNNQCIPNSWVCDGAKDCSNGQDENNCHLLEKCPEDHYKCANRNCVQDKLRCNGVDDCGDASDEAGCMYQMGVVFPCPLGKFRCHLGPCVPNNAKCDGYKDCPHGDDEKDYCPSTVSPLSCGLGFYSCSSGSITCIPEMWKCDGASDCADGSDEINCDADGDKRLTTDKTGHHVHKLYSTVKHCVATEFSCDSGECVAREKLCNGVRDCKDGSDEHIWCGACHDYNGGCDHQCRETPTGTECHCSKGFRLLSDGRTCVDIDECVENDRVCDHFCNNTRGKYTCYCAPGYKLTNDGLTCKLVNQDGFLLFATGPEVRQMPLNSAEEGARYGILLETTSGDNILGLDHNTKNQHTYFLADNRIYYKYERSVCLVEGLNKGINVAVDWVTDNVYFADEDPPELGLCTWDGRFCTIFKLGNMQAIRGLALHPKRGLMFWTDWGTELPRIERANMDGTERTPIIVQKITWPNALAIDYIHEKVYWGDAKYRLIERCDLDGSRREIVLATAVRHPFDMAIFMGRVFWSDWSTQSIVSVRARDGEDHKTLHSLLMHPFGVSINHSMYHDKNLPNPCLVANCSHACALKSSNGSFAQFNSVSPSCLCPAGYTTLDDNLTCAPSFTSTEINPRWCSETFQEYCKLGVACLNGGKCEELFDEDENIESVGCDCPNGYGGLYCEVDMSVSTVKDHYLAKGISLPVYKRDVSNDGQSSSGGTVATTVIIFLVLVCFAVAGVCLVKRVDLGRRIYNQVWSSSQLFRRRLSSQHENIVKNEEGVNPKLEKAESFSNPVYEGVQVPMHGAYMSFKCKAVDSNDSGLEFNVSRPDPPSPCLY